MGRRLLSKIDNKGCERIGPALNFYFNCSIVVEYKASQPIGAGKSVDERTKTHALHDSIYNYPMPKVRI